MRVVAILALALLLAGCEGDRIKHGMQAPQSAGLPT
jgi:PBP1b-binding outer membrane lipoprotein LpoB